MSNSEDSYGLVIFELTAYIVLTPLLLYVFWQHGPRGLFGWVFLVIFVLLQLIAAGLEVAAGQHSTSRTGAIIASIGLSPLFLTVDGLLREVSSVLEKSSRLFNPILSSFFHLSVVGAAVLVGVGSSSLYSTDSSSSAAGEIKGGVVIFITAWAFLVLLTFRLCLNFHKVGQLNRLLVAIILALPLLAIRVAYSALFAFDSSSSTFSPLNGNIAVRVVMEVLPPLFASIVLIVAGIVTWKHV